MSDLISKFETIKAMASEPPELHYPDWYISLVYDMKTPWIPVSERLPEKDGIYIVTIDTDDYPDLVHPIDMVHMYHGKWCAVYYDKLEPCDARVVAWMELPEPYEGGDDE